MSKQPDLSAFPIPRKGGAKPIASGEVTEMLDVTSEGAGDPARVFDIGGASAQAVASINGVAATHSPEASIEQRLMPKEALPNGRVSSGQVVATTVKLDENRYLRLAEAGKPGPGRIRRRTIQDMVIQALDEWLERRNL